MSTPGRICRDKEAPVATNETGIKHKFCREKASSITIMIIPIWKNLLRHKKSFKERALSVCRDTERRNICCGKVMYVATLKEKETLVATNKQGYDM